MIVIDSKQTEVPEVQSLLEEQADGEPPPTYASIQHTPSSIQTTTVSGGNPTTYVSVIQVHDSLRKNITIDPTLYIPDSLLPPLSPHETPLTRKHLRLESTHGSISASIKIANSFGPNYCRVLMLMRSTHGGIRAKIEGSEHRHPFQLIAHSTNGNITLQLPRSFQGPIMMSLGHGSVKFSKEIEKNLTCFDESNCVRHYFVGNFLRWVDLGGEDWTGDEAIIESKHGGVKIHYKDDVTGGLRILGF